MASISPTRPAGMGLLALLPVAVYAVLRPEPIVILSALCVGLIAASLYLLFGPAEAETDADAPAA